MAIKILIIEDDELNRRMYQQIFTFRGYDVALASNGEEGIDQAKTAKPTLILLDIMMPKLNGLDTMKRLKTIPEVSTIPVIILTNVMGKAEAEAAIDLGAMKYIIKSDYTPNEVADIVDSLLEKIRR